MTDDGVRMYLRDIGQYPLLVAEQEAPLGRAIQEGILVDGAQTLVRSLGKRVIGTELIEEGKQFIEALKSDQSTTAPDKILQAKSPYLAALNFVVRASLTPVVHEREVQAKISAMESAKHELTVTNLRLVVSIAKRYQGNGVDLLDLIQEGNIGLTTAVRKFDSEMGFKFSTYATWWIRQAIQRGLSDQSTTIRVPIHAKEKYFSALRAADNDATKLSREMRSIHSLSRPVALDQPVGENGDTALIDLIADSTDGPEYNAVSLVSTTELGADLALLRKNIATFSINVLG
jgi:RNA polymerase sigma factor (sigma-70 family)